MKIDNTHLSSLDLKRNILNERNKPKADNIEPRSRVSENNRDLAPFKTNTDKPENTVRDIAISLGQQKSLLQLRHKTFSLMQILNHFNRVDSPFHSERPFSGNTNVLQIRSFNLDAIRGADISDLSVDVKQVARAQKNEGIEMNSNALATEAGFSEGQHHIAMNVNGRDVNIRFNVSANDRVEDVQRRIADAINDSRVGIRASVSLDEETGMSSLVINSMETGIDRDGHPNFTFRSIAGNAVEVSGIDNITQEAQNSIYRVNRSWGLGEWQSSRSNAVTVGPGISVQLVGTGRVQFSMGRDESVQSSTMKDMARLFNDLMAFARDNEQGNSIIQEMSSIAKESSSILSNIGISLDQDGFMLIDDERLNAAAASGELEQFALQDGTDFIAKLARLLENIDKNPMALFDVETPLVDILH